jgi:iron-sulfur cluster assembly protein
MTAAALTQVKFLREKQGQDLCLRVGVRQGGCSGMSYLMDFIDASTIDEKDEVYDYEGFQVVCDPKSLLYLYGLVLDYSDSLIGGGFQFSNPNATQSCGCGKSFSA